MNTTEELLENTEVQEDVVLPATDETPDLDDEMEIPENYFADVKDEDFVATDTEEDMSIFQMDFSDVEEEEVKEAEREAQKELKKQQKLAKKAKGWFTLLVRIMVIVMGPIFVISLFYIIDSVSSAKKLTHQLVNGEMQALTVSAGRAKRLTHSAAASNASVESKPPETPMTIHLLRECSNRRIRPHT
jgi:cytoskeletal protein RodZ